jgi:hypothetical protein
MPRVVPPEYLWMYIAANAFSLATLALAFWSRTATRWVAVGLFAWASVINGHTALTRPDVYREYATLALSESYRSFILGWFSDHIRLVVLTIAVGQAGIALLMARRTGLSLRLGAAGAILFLFAIAPLGVGAGFPFSLTFSAALLVVIGAEHVESRILQRVIVRAPQLIGLGMVLLLASFALDALNEGAVNGEALAGFILHLAPAAIAALVLAVSWRWRRVGGLLCFVAAMVYVALSQGRISWMLVIAAPLVVEGALFLWSSRVPPLRRSGQ